MKLLNFNHGVSLPNTSPGYKWRSWTKYTKALNNEINSLIYYIALFDPEYKVLNSAKNLDLLKYPEFNDPSSDWYWDFINKKGYSVVVGLVDQAMLDEFGMEYIPVVQRYNSNNELKFAALNNEGQYEFVPESTSAAYFCGIDLAGGVVQAFGRHNYGAVSSDIYYLFLGNKLDFHQGICNFTKNGYLLTGGTSSLEEAGARYAGVDESENISVWIMTRDQFSTLFQKKILADFLVGYILFSNAREENEHDNLDATERRNINNYFFMPLATASFFSPQTTANGIRFVNNEELASKVNQISLSLNWHFHRYSYHTDTNYTSVCGWYNWHVNSKTVSLLAKDLFNSNVKYIQDGNGGSWINNTLLTHELQYNKTGQQIETFYTSDYGVADAIQINNRMAYTYNILNNDTIKLQNSVKILLF